MFRAQDVGIGFEWTGTGAGPFVVSNPALGFDPPGEDQADRLRGWRAINLDNLAQIQMFDGVWNNATGELAVATVLHPAAAVSFGTGRKLVHLVPSITDMAQLEADGRSIHEGADFAAGGTFTIDPTNPRHRSIKVFGAAANSLLLTAPMTVSLNPSSVDWGDRVGAMARVYVEKSESSAHAVTVLGGGADGTSNRVLWVIDQHVSAERRADSDGPGPNGEIFHFKQTFGRTLTRDLLVNGASVVTPNPTDIAIVYDQNGVFRGRASTAAMAASSTGTFNPASVQIDAQRQFSQYNQSGAVAFAKAAGGTFLNGLYQEVLFNSTGAALTWSADFENYATLATADLPASLPVGLHRIGLVWSAPRAKIQVAFPRVLSEEIHGTLTDVVMKRYDETRATPQTNVTGALTLNRALGAYHHVTHGAGNITSVTVQNWPSADFGSILVDYKQDSVGGRTIVHPTGTVWFGGTPTFDTAANKTNRVLYTNAASAGVLAHYGGAA
jgi:hypothetical protein